MYEAPGSSRLRPLHSGMDAHQEMDLIKNTSSPWREGTFGGGEYGELRLFFFTWNPGLQRWASGRRRSERAQWGAAAEVQWAGVGGMERQHPEETRAWL